MKFHAFAVDGIKELEGARVEFLSAGEDIDGVITGRVDNVDSEYRSTAKEPMLPLQLDHSSKLAACLWGSYRYTSMHVFEVSGYGCQHIIQVGGIPSQDCFKWALVRSLRWLVEADDVSLLRWLKAFRSELCAATCGRDSTSPVTE